MAQTGKSAIDGCRFFSTPVAFIPTVYGVPGIVSTEYRHTMYSRASMATDAAVLDLRLCISDPLEPSQLVLSPSFPAWSHPWLTTVPYLIPSNKEMFLLSGASPGHPCRVSD